VAWRRSIKLVVLACLLVSPCVARASAEEYEDPFQASFYTGIGIDSFAAGEINRYINPEDSSDIRERYVAGIDFAYRIFGKDEDRNQLWVFGETVHGLRSTEVDCEKNPDLPVCDDLTTSPGQRTLFILRNASSLEAYGGFSYYFGKVQGQSDSVGRTYLKVQLGFLTVSGSGGDVADMHHVALGLEAFSGRYQGSYLEAGYGRTDLFLVHPKDRWKIDGFLTWKASNKLFTALKASPFVQIRVDADAGSGSDSIQSYFGFDFDLGTLFGTGD